MFMQRRSQFDKSEKRAYFVSWCVVGGPSFLRGTTRGLHQPPINQNFELNKSRQKFHHSLKDHHKISNIPEFRCKTL